MNFFMSIKKLLLFNMPPIIGNKKEKSKEEDIATKDDNLGLECLPYFGEGFEHLQFRDSSDLY